MQNAERTVLPEALSKQARTGYEEITRHVTSKVRRKQLAQLGESIAEQEREQQFDRRVVGVARRINGLVHAIDERERPITPSLPHM